MAIDMAPLAHRIVMVDGRAVATDSEGYLLHRDDWSEAFAVALAREEGLTLTSAHWELIRFLREHFQSHGVQAQVRVMVKHFTQAWGPERGSNHALHDMFPIGGPQKQGNRLAGLLRTKGEH
ncbi:TusE/DsrC/DsvC family sulfur relay protein [Ideonella sp. A 288]|uniref:TusE/DsrC/DsvC family sulfur relay protein n=1 Tax=Ideonella sp. A 288 TaxID=1962181 RepID=UPI000B4B42B4|nr:TusE/DsrC/DsvC family sulfur relay protein [Ideonella sp. A 288]